MAFIRPRSRVTLHSGGATVRNKRLTGVKASERATAPGKDIRDIGPDKGPRKCRACSKPIGRLRGVHCESCLSDQKLVKEVRAELKRLNLPRLGVAVPKGSHVEEAQAGRGCSPAVGQGHDPCPLRRTREGGEEQAAKAGSRTEARDRHLPTVLRCSANDRPV